MKLPAWHSTVVGKLCLHFLKLVGCVCLSRNTTKLEPQRHYCQQILFDEKSEWHVEEEGVCLSFTFISSACICQFSCLPFYIYAVPCYCPTPRRKRSDVGLDNSLHKNSFLINTLKSWSCDIFQHYFKLHCRPYN